MKNPFTSKMKHQIPNGAQYKDLNIKHITHKQVFVIKLSFSKSKLTVFIYIQFTQISPHIYIKNSQQ